MLLILPLYSHNQAVYQFIFPSTLSLVRVELHPNVNLIAMYCISILLLFLMCCVILTCCIMFMGNVSASLLAFLSAHVLAPLSLTVMIVF